MTMHFNAMPQTVPQAAVAAHSEGRSEARGAVTAVRTGLYRHGVKRALDMMLILLALPFVLPLLLLMALAVMTDGHSPFYRQERVGRNGRAFNLLKIRTMVPDAKAALEDYLARNPEAKAEWDETQKLKCDPRITWAGRLLRKTSLDELPQLWNVIKGDMSIVGPRPMMPEQRALYPGQAYYHLRPGITGAWQVSDRNEGSFAGRAKFDADYYNNLSLATDCSILLRTVAVVVRGTGY